MTDATSQILTEDILRAVSQALGDTDNGLTNSEIDDLLRLCKVPDELGPGTKWQRIHHNLWNHQARTKSRVHILGFIRKSMKPALHLKKQERFEEMRSNLNRALSFDGLYVDESGNLTSTTKATTIDEAERRANVLISSLKARGVHPDVLKFCRSELLADNYFHAVQEAAKSIFDKMRKLSGLTNDGGMLVDAIFSGTAPMFVINDLLSESERSEQKGFVNLIKGTYGMFRNVTAHEARINWDMKREDAEDLLSLASMIHRRLDSIKRRDQ